MPSGTSEEKTIQRGLSEVTKTVWHTNSRRKRDLKNRVLRRHNTDATTSGRRARPDTAGTGLVETLEAVSACCHRFSLTIYKNKKNIFEHRVVRNIDSMP